jgi:hypothetical protein
MQPCVHVTTQSATSWWNRGLQGTSNDEGNGFPRMMGEYRCMGGNFARERHGYETAHRLWLQQLLVPVAWRGTWGHLRRLHCRKLKADNPGKPRLKFEVTTSQTHVESRRTWGVCVSRGSAAHTKYPPKFCHVGIPLKFRPKWGSVQF